MSKKNNTQTNICRFINYTPSQDDNINVINFVHETQHVNQEQFMTSSFFRMCLVTDGTGVFTTFNKQYDLEIGDLFLIFPAQMFKIKNVKDLTITYISFISGKAYHLLDKFDITKNNNYRKGFNDLAKTYKSTVLNQNADTKLASEGLLLYTLSLLTPQVAQNDIPKSNLTALKIMHLIEENYCDSNFSLTSAAKQLNYSEKYISSIFKKQYGVKFSTYITDLRLNNVSRLIDAGFTSIKEIATLSGFADALYLSKLFKKYNNRSPTEYINIIQANLKNKQQN